MRYLYDNQNKMRIYISSPFHNFSMNFPVEKYLIDYLKNESTIGYRFEFGAVCEV